MSRTIELPMVDYHLGCDPSKIERTGIPDWVRIRQPGTPLMFELPDGVITAIAMDAFYHNVFTFRIKSEADEVIGRIRMYRDIHYQSRQLTVKDTLSGKGMALKVKYEGTVIPL